MDFDCGRCSGLNFLHYKQLRAIILCQETELGDYEEGRDFSRMLAILVVASCRTPKLYASA